MVMKRKKISELVMEISEGIFSSLIDLLLWNIFYFFELSPLKGGNWKRADVLADKDLAKFNSVTLKRALVEMRKRGWIKGDLVLTKEGKERLENILPRYFGKKKWDGNWYLAIYDIPEEKKIYREILRATLKRLGFGQLNKSVWVCPFNFLGEVEKIIKDYNLSHYVVLAITDKLGREEAGLLANKVWKLDKVNYH